MVDIRCDLYATKLLESGEPRFIFIITTQEVDCIVSKKDGVPTSGNSSTIKRVTYYAALGKKDHPNLEKVGHYWELKEIQQTGETKQLL